LDERLFYSYNTWRSGTFTLTPDIVERDIHDRAIKLVKEKEILSLLGLRQTGKSTLAFQLIHDLLKKQSVMRVTVSHEGQVLFLAFLLNISSPSSNLPLQFCKPR
jgi:predicted AAA+ superfamily ATPase